MDLGPPGGAYPGATFGSALSWTNLNKAVQCGLARPNRVSQSHIFGRDLMSSFFAAVDIGSSIQQGLDAFFAFIPRLLGFLIVLLIGYIVARIVKTVLVKVLDRVGLDHAMHSGSVGSYVNKAAPDFSPSRVIGAIAFWFIFLGAVSIAV